MKITAKRFFTRCAVFAALLMCLFACCATAGAEDVYTDHAELLRDGFLPAKQPMDIIVLRGENFEEFLISQFEARATEFSALNYELTPAEFRQAYTDVLDKNPELFYAPDSWSYSMSGDYVATVWVEYTLTEAEIASKTAAFNASVQEVVRYAAQADTTLGKIMMVHDYLCTSYEYDTDLTIYSAEEMFRLGTGVCQAYLQCFQAVMNELGIACEPVTSESMNHGWNMVQLDGSWYHLDATWDDPTSDMPLRARHQYFLLSNDGIEANEHTGWTCAQSATSTKYDSFFWASVNNPIPVVGDAMYYAEMNTTDYTRTLKKWDMSANTTTDVHTYSIASEAGRIRYANGYNPMAASDSHLYYATVDKVYGLPIEGGTPELMHTFTSDECVWTSWFDGSAVQVFASADINTATEPVKLQDLGYVSPYTYTDNGDGTCTITGYTGSDSNLVVPETIDGLTVTTIGPNAFYFKVWDDAAGDMVSTLEVTSIQLPSTLTTLEWMAINSCEITEITLPASLTSFVGNSIMDCQKLASVTVEAGNTAYTAVNNAVYTADMSTLVFCPIGADNGSFAVPEGVTTIGKWAFSYNKDLAAVTLPEGLQELQINAFYNCSALASINLPSTLTTLGDSAFENTGLTSVVIPEGITALSNYLFMGCASLTEVVLPDGIESVGAMPFEFCPAVIYCNNGTTTAATLDAAGIAHQEQVYFTYTDNGDGTCTITGYTGTDTEVEIPSSINGLTVTAIGEGAFFTMTDTITSVVIPDTVTTIGNDAFMKCFGLASITIPDSVTSIGEGAFAYTALISVDLPDGLTEIASTMFTGSALESIAIPDSVTTIGWDAFSQCESLVSVELPEGLTTISNGAFYQCCELASINIPSTVTTIDAYAFEGCNVLTALDLPDSITVIGEEAFDADTLLLCNAGSTTATTLTAAGWSFQSPENSDYTLWQYADDYDEAYLMVIYNGRLTGDVTVPASIQGTPVRGLKANAFSAPEASVTITLPNLLMYIDETAFDSCPNATLQCDAGSVTATVISTYGHAFAVSGYEGLRFSQSVDSEADTYRPILTVTGYVGSAAEVEVPGTVIATEVVAIGEGAFQNNETLTSVSIGEGVVTIGENAFNDCSGIRTISLPTTIQSIGRDAFYGCSGVKEVYIPTLESWVGIEYANDMAHPMCIPYTAKLYVGGELLKEAVIPEGITSIGDFQFLQCSALESVTIPSSVKTIGENAFGMCTSLKEVNLSEGLESIDLLAFCSCEALKSVVIPEGVVTIGDYAFSYCTGLTSIILPASVESMGTYTLRDSSRVTATVVENSYAHNWCLNRNVAVKLVSDPTNFSYTGNSDGTCTITGYAGDATELVIPATIDGLKVTAIGEEAFVDLVDITSVTLPEGLETIGVMAFGYCEKLTAIHVPASVTSIQHHAFSPYSGIQNITVDENNPNYASVDGVLFSKDLSTLLRYPAARPNDSYTVPAGTTVIGNWAFNMSQSLRQVILPEGVTTLSDCAFGYAVGLELVNLPASISFIDPDAFFGCGNVMCQVEPDSYAHLWCHLNGVETDQAAIPFEIADNGDGTCTIVRCLSKAEHVDVPASICGLKVIALGEESFLDRTNMVSITLPEGLEVIGSWAFEMAESLQTIHIPSTVREIGANAFAHYSGLTSITVEPGSAYFTSVDGVLFTADMSTLVRYPASRIAYSYTAPEGVTTVQERAFNGSALLNEIYLPDSVTTIGERAFDNCVNLLYVSLPGNVSFIGEDALANCGNVTAGVVEGSYAHQWCIDNEIWWSLLQNKYGEYAYHDNGDGTCLITGYSGSDSHVDVPAEINGLKVVGLAEFAFDMSPMTSITLPEGLETIDELAFCFCENLTEITVPASVTHVAARAFSPYSGVQNIYVADGSQSYVSVDGVLFTKDMSKLVRYPAARTAESYTVPAGVKVIGPESMHLSYALDTIVLPEGVTTIDECAFAYCVSLDSINLPASITSIADYAFDNCGNVVATVVDGSYAHNWCVENDVAVNVVPAPAKLYTYTDNGDGTCTITGYTGEETELVIPATIDGLKVTAIGERAIYNNDQITSVVIPEGVTSIGAEAFWSCSSLQNVSLPSTLESIDAYAFTFCFKLAELTIPAATTSIAEAAFASMPTVMTVENGNTAYKMVDDVLCTIDGRTLLFCPNFKTGVFEVSQGTERIGEMAFWGTDVTEIHIPASVSQIFFHAFGETYFMERFVVDDASQHFADVDGMLLTKDGTQLYCVPQTFGGTLTVPDGVKIIKEEAVRNYNITNVVLPEGITTLEGGAFLNLPLETASLPLSLTDIHDNAFANCGDFTATVYDGSVAHIWCVENGITVNVLENPYPGMIIPMDMSRLEVGPTVPTGLPFTVQTADGSLQITYDGENANWDDVATYAYIEEGMVSHPVRIEVASVNAAEVRLICGQWETDEEILTALDAAEAYELVGDTLYHWIPYAEVDTANGTVTPISTDCTVAIQYRNTDGTVLYNEKFDLDVSCTTQGTFPATVNWIDMTTATPNYHGLEGITSRVEGNTLIYTLPAGFRELVATAFPVPEGTEGFSLDHLWMTGLWELRDGMARWAYNLAVLPVTYETPVAFYDTNGSFLGGGRVCVRFEEELVVTSVAADRINLCTQPGLVLAEQTLADGQVSLTIDSAATDWTAVVSYSTSLLDLGLSFEVSTPSGAVSCKTLNDSYETDEEILAAFERVPNTNYVDEMCGATLGACIGWYDHPDNVIITPAEVSQISAVQWLDENGNILATEKLNVAIQHTSMAEIPAERIVLDPSTALPNASGYAGVTSRVMDNTLVYTVPEDWDGSSIVTDIPAPEGAAYYTMSDYRFKPDWIAVENGYARHWLYTGPNAQEAFTAAIAWYDENGTLLGGGHFQLRWQVEGTVSVQRVPVSRIRIDSIPYGMDMSLAVVDGDIYAYIDDEATDWNKVLTFNEPLHLYDPSTGENWYETNEVNFGFSIDAPEGAAYVYYTPGSWNSDEELVAFMESCELDDASTTGPGWWNEIVTFEDGQATTIPLNSTNSVTTYAVRWADENGETILMEKVEVCYEHSNPYANYPASLIQIPAEDILPNVTGAENVICTVEEGHVTHTFSSTDVNLRTYVTAPEGAVTYTVSSNGYDPDMMRIALVDGCYAPYGLSSWNEDETTTSTSRLLCWYDQQNQLIGGGWITYTFVYEPLAAIEAVPLDRITIADTPVGMALENRSVDGSIHVYIDDEATDWNKVATFNEPLYLHDPSTGESWYETGHVNYGFMIDAPEGAAYMCSVPGYFASDEELRDALDQQTIHSTASFIPSWYKEICVFEETQVRVQSIGCDEYSQTHPATYAVRWFDENQNELLTEKVTVRYEHSHDGEAFDYSLIQIPAEDILPNTSGVSYADYTVSDGLLELTFTNRWPDIFTLVEAPEGTASYSMCDEGFDPDAERYELVDGRYVGYELSGWPEGQTESSYKTLHCWYDAEGNLIGGGWCTFHYTKAEAQLPAFKLPAAMCQIEAEAFLNASVQNVILPDGCESIGDRAFAGCYLLQEITIPASVTAIAYDAFDGCEELTITAEDGSYAEIYAEEHGIACFTK